MKKFTAYFEKKPDGKTHVWVIDDSNNKPLMQIDANHQRVNDLYTDIRRDVSEMFSDGPLQRFLPVRTAYITRMFIPMQEAGINDLMQLTLEMEPYYSENNNDIRGCICPFCNDEQTWDMDLDTAHTDGCSHLKETKLLDLSDGVYAVYVGQTPEALEGVLL